MFKDRYKRSMDAIEPPRAAVEALKKAAEDGAPLPRRKIRVKKVWFRAGALAACAALVFALYNPAVQLFSEKSSGDAAKNASSYSEIYKLIKSANNGGYYYNDGRLGAEAPAAEKDNSNTSGENSQDYSETNLQVAGVDEADIVKTDGEYIYAVGREYIYIVSVNGGELSLVSKVARFVFEDGTLTSRATELYIRGGKLILLKEILVGEPYSADDIKDGGVPAPSYDGGGESIEPSRGSAGTDGVSDAKPADSYYYNYYIYGETSAGVEIYDISDRANPKALNEIGQSGYIISSRMVGDILYLVSNYSVYNAIERNNPETYIPMTYENGQSQLVAASDIIYKPDAENSSYTIVSGIDISGGGETVSVKSVLGYGGTIYATANNLYIASPDYISEQVDNYIENYSTTKLIRFALNRGNITLAAQGTISGVLINQFAMDEYNGVLRVVVTVDKYRYSVDGNGDGNARIYAERDEVYVSPENGEETPTSGAANADKPDAATDSSTAISINDNVHSSLYTLDENLAIIGKIENLAPGERVYSVRFDGAIGYFVTFLQVDPLFSADLTDPANPKIIGELKIPGFSNYLHPYGTGLLFGLGMDADEQTGRTQYMKLSMFDIADPADVTEKHKLVLEGLWYSEASYNHKAILIDAGKNIIGFQSEGYYLFYSYDAQTGFNELARIELYNNSNGYYFDMSSARGLYIGDCVYLVNSDSIVCYDIVTFEHVGSLSLIG